MRRRTGGRFEVLMVSRQDVVQELTTSQRRTGSFHDMRWRNPANAGSGTEPGGAGPHLPTCQLERHLLQVGQAESALTLGQGDSAVHGRGPA